MAIDLGFDEGGSGDKLLVSVQIGIAEQARKLNRKWKARLPEKLPYFHSKDFGVYNGGIFTKAGLDRPARTLLLKDLASLIHRHLLTAVTARISIREFEALTTQDFRSRVGTAYAFAIDAGLLMAYALVKDMGLRPEFNVLIERGHRNSEQVAQILDALQKFPAELQASMGDEMIPDIRILTAGLGEKKDHPILQAADMVAYSEWQGATNGDPTIWNAINRAGVRYRTGRVLCGREVIQRWVEKGMATFIRKQRKRKRVTVV